MADVFCPICVSRQIVVTPIPHEVSDGAQVINHCLATDNAHENSMVIHSHDTIPLYATTLPAQILLRASSAVVIAVASASKFNGAVVCGFPQPGNISSNVMVYVPASGIALGIIV